jgi:poly(hydroxyalkanoate) depolymerase family esterase
MRRLSDTIRRLSALRTQSRSAPDGGAGAGAGPSRLTTIADFGVNPGALNAHVFVPADLPDRAALVVVLHGCTQTAAGYDRGSGWSRLAERHGFAVLFPEQTRANNPNGCFNWFSPDDARRSGGEALSIRRMVGHVLARHPTLDPKRVFVTGLSAGGAMAMVMLATYPEVFAGGAVIAGLPFGTATSVPEAFDRMRGHGGPAGPAALERLVRDATPHSGPWPTLSVWHGDADRTVDPSNAEAILAQWRHLHGLGAEPARVERGPGYVRRVWSDAEGRERIEDFRVAGMGHGTPLDVSRSAAMEVGGAYMLDVGVSSTRHIAHFWGIAPAPAPAEAAVREPVRGQRGVGRPYGEMDDPSPEMNEREPALAEAEPRPDREQIGHRPVLPSGGAVGRVIEDALRRAGLMR